MKDEKLNLTGEEGTSTGEKSAYSLQLEVDELVEQVDSLKVQIAMPLTTMETAQLLAIVGEQKTKASDQQKRHVEDQLIAKLDGYLNPPPPGLFDKKEE